MANVYGTSLLPCASLLLRLSSLPLSSSFNKWPLDFRHHERTDTSTLRPALPLKTLHLCTIISAQCPSRQSSDTFILNTQNFSQPSHFLYLKTCLTVTESMTTSGDVRTPPVSVVKMCADNNSTLRAAPFTVSQKYGIIYTAFIAATKSTYKRKLSSIVPSGNAAATALYVTQYTEIWSLTYWGQVANLGRFQFYCLWPMRMLITILRRSCIMVKAKLLTQVHANKYRTNLANKMSNIWKWKEIAAT